jgi:elongation factor 1-gamma
MLSMFIARLFELLLDQQWRSQNPATVRYFETVVSHPFVQAVVPRSEFILIDVETPNEDPNREKTD